MGNKPNLPILAIEQNRFIELITIESIHSFSKASALQIIEGSGLELFSVDGSIWKLEQFGNKFRDTIITRFLAKTVYNPTYTVTLNWIKIGVYKLDELKQKICDCIQKDDDILTQFVSAELFIDKINNSKDFNAVIAVLENNT